MRAIKFLTTVLMVLVLAACGSTSEPADTEADQPAVTEADQPDQPTVTEADQPAVTEAAEPTEVRLVFSSSVPNTTHMIIYAVPETLGYFEEENLEVTTSFVDGSTAAIQAVASRSGDITNPEAGNLLGAVGSGIPIKGFSGLVQHWQWLFAVDPESSIESVEDLAGGKVGVISLASGSYVFAKAALESSGVDISEVEFIPVGLGATAASALMSGDVDALSSWNTEFETTQQSGVEFRLIPAPEFFNEIPGLVLVGQSDDIDQDGDKYARYARAVYKALVFAATNPEAAVQIGYDTFPDLKPADADFEERLANDTRIMQMETSDWLPDAQDRSTWHDFGMISEAGWDKLQDYAKGGEVIEESISMDEAWDASLRNQINDFDVEAIISEAESFGS